MIVAGTLLALIWRLAMHSRVSRNVDDVPSFNLSENRRDIFYTVRNKNQECWVVSERFTGTYWETNLLLLIACVLLVSDGRRKKICYA